MPRLRLILQCCALMPLVWPASTDAANRVTVQSKTFHVNTGPDTVGILIENDVNIIGLVVPIEMRALSGGAFTKPPFTNTSFKWQEVPNSRIAMSPLGQLPDTDDRWPAALIERNRYAVIADPWVVCSGPTSNTYGDRSLQCDGISPDGLFYAAISTGDERLEEISLMPGTDASPSLEIIFPVNGNAGIFEIDTCCMTHSNHLYFVNEDVEFVPGVQFVKGTITILACDCDCFGDPICDSVVSDVLDVVSAIDVAFRNTPEVSDPSETCPQLPADVDCSGSIDVIDVVRIVNVAFRNANPEAEYCQPCL